jgi:hypothetical protein
MRFRYWYSSCGGSLADDAVGGGTILLVVSFGVSGGGDGEITGSRAEGDIFPAMWSDYSDRMEGCFNGHFDFETRVRVQIARLRDWLIKPAVLYLLNMF